MTASDDSRRVTVDRRELLALSGTVLASFAGCFAQRRSDGDDESHPNGSSRRILPDADFEIGFRQMGIETAVWTKLSDVVSETRTQGIAYRDGRLYVAGTEEGSHSTVYEFRRDGSPTGRSHRFGSGGHVNCLQWHDGALWAMGFTAGTVYKTEFEAGTVLDSFDYGDGVVLSGSPNNFAFVPTGNGDDRMIAVAEFGSTEGHVIDHESALEDGTAAGNVDAEIDAGPFANTDGAHYRDGHAYFTQYPGGDARGAAFAVSLPVTGQMGDGYRIGADGVEWYHPFETWSDSGHVQDLTYDGDEAVWYLVSDDDDKTVYRGPEHVHATVPQPWSVWDTVDSEPYGATLRLGASAGERRLPVFGDAASNVAVVVPFYDDGARSGTRVSVGVEDESERSVAVGVDTAAESGAGNYRLRDGSWSDTGIARVDEAWVLFGFDASGESIDAHVSTDGGKTWHRAGETTRSSVVAAVALHSGTADAGIEIGPISFYVDR